MIKTAPLGLLAVFAVGLSLAAVPARAETEGDCRSVAAAPAGIQSFSTVRRAVTGDVVRAQLCQEAGRWIYRITVVSTSGAVRTILLDAQTGSPLDR